MFNLSKLFKSNKNDTLLAKDELAAFLKVTPEALEAFENAYQTEILDKPNTSKNLFDAVAKEATSEHIALSELPEDLIHQIVDELLQKSVVFSYDGKKSLTKTMLPVKEGRTVSQSDIAQLPEHLRPELTGNLMKVDIPGASRQLLWCLKESLTNADPNTRQISYHHFRQGLDILDLDALIYEILGRNQNSMGNWFPQLVDAVQTQDFFKLPKTKILKVPMSLLQLTRLDYSTLSPTTIAILDKFVYDVFDLDEQGDYFIKTGTYSSKFEFRNARVHSPQEIRELGQYLLFIHHNALQLASPLNNRSLYGVSTTTEWVVREYIKDTEGNPTIYKGMPLRTEYRVFIDCDSKQIIGINPYWDPEVMKKRFGHEDDAHTPHQMHDYVIYKMHEETLMKRYHDNKDLVLKQVESLIQNLNLTGQWSLDIMQNGNDFYLIDMALAENSAFYECVPHHLRKPTKEDWVPRLPKPQGV